MLLRKLAIACTPLILSSAEDPEFEVSVIVFILSFSLLLQYLGRPAKQYYDETDVLNTLEIFSLAGAIAVLVSGLGMHFATMVPMTQQYEVVSPEVVAGIYSDSLIWKLLQLVHIY